MAITQGGVSTGGSILKKIITKASFDEEGGLKFQPWTNLEVATGAGSPYEFIQPRSGWLNGEQVTTYHMKVQISFLSGCTLYIESSTTEEGPWTTAVSYTEQTDTMAVISSEGGGARFSGYVRWRVSGDAPYQICFQLEALPGASIASNIPTPKTV